MISSAKKRSIAWRITLVLTSLITLAVLVTVSLTFFVHLRIERNMIKELIQTESERLESRVSRSRSEWTAPFEREMAPTMFVWGESAEHPAPGLPRELRDLPDGVHQLEREESTWHVAISPVMDGRLYVLYDTIILERNSADFLKALISILIGCCLLAMLVSSTVARWLVYPLNALTNRLMKWIPDFPIADVPHGNESDRLMYIFNRVQDRVDASIADQREFSANLHHEIRTPLTIIRSDAELMLATPKQTESMPFRLERIVKSVQEISQSLESTYSLAQARFEDVSRINVHACVQDIFEGLSLEAASAGLTLVNAVKPDHEETLSEQALMTVLRNIVRNAILHASPSTLVVASTEHGLTLTDTGPGIAPQDLDNIFERYFSNRRTDRRPRNQVNHMEAQAADINRTGLGLAIAKRICTMQGWGLEVGSPVQDGKGTRFSFTLRPLI